MSAKLYAVATENKTNRQIAREAISEFHAKGPDHINVTALAPSRESMRHDTWPREGLRKLLADWYENGIYTGGFK